MTLVRSRGNDYRDLRLVAPFPLGGCSIAGFPPRSPLTLFPLQFKLFDWTGQRFRNEQLKSAYETQHATNSYKSRHLSCHLSGLQAPHGALGDSGPFGDFGLSQVLRESNPAEATAKFAKNGFVGEERADLHKMTFLTLKLGKRAQSVISDRLSYTEEELNCITTSSDVVTTEQTGLCERLETCAYWICR